MKIIVDLDNVLCDYEGAMKKKAIEHDYPEVVEAMNSPQRITLELDHDTTVKMNDIASKPGFFYNLKLIPGAKESLQKLVQAGHDVFICTEPHKGRSMDEKYQWVEDNLGDAWTKKLIITYDKTMISGDFLIDDNPCIEGSKVPEWEQIVFGQSYNSHINNGLRINNWEDFWNTTILVKKYSEPQEEHKSYRLQAAAVIVLISAAAWSLFKN